MIQNERQYRITQTKLKEFERDLAALDPPLGSLPCLGNPDGKTPLVLRFPHALRYLLL